MTTLTPQQVAEPRNALPFFLSFGTLPLALVGAGLGGLWVLALPVYCWCLFPALDAVLGLNLDDASLDTTDDQLRLYRLLTMAWFPLQFTMLCFMLWYVPQAAHLTLAGKIGLFFGMGVMTGTIGLPYAHELMHQSPRSERWLGDLLLASVLYCHFRTEHLRVHHSHVGTPRDAVTARYNEGFHRFYPRVLRECLRSAWAAEKAMLARRGLPVWHLSNPFWRYAALQAGMLVLAFWLGGWGGLALFLLQAGVAVWQLELANYVEHYGLTREHLGDGRYERVLPRHSWNAAHRATNWLLINLQRHSDHHTTPSRRFPLLQNHPADQAPQLPFGYPAMTFAAMIPPLWRRVMNPRVRAWRRQFYPQITDWQPYNKAQNPKPTGAP